MRKAAHTKVTTGTKPPTQQELKRRDLARKIKQDIVRGYHRLGGIGTATWMTVLIERHLRNFTLFHNSRRRS
jgi:hypothetical protein